MPAPCDISYLIAHCNQSLGKYQGREIFIVDQDDPLAFLNSTNYAVIAQTARLVEYRNGFRVIGHVASNWEVKIYDKPLPYVPKAKKKEEDAEPPVDISLENAINETLKGKTLDDLLAGFNYGLE